MKQKIIVGISGASGAIYAISLVKALLSHRLEVHLIISDMGVKVFSHELDIRPGDIPGVFSGKPGRGKKAGRVITHDCADMFAPVASGSFQAHAMIIVPCSMKTLSAVASGYTTNLLERAADVTLKERRPLILVTRETPLSRVHLSNMMAAHDAGAVIMPAAPGFYHHPQTLDDLATFLVARILDHLGIEHSDSPRWGDQR